MSEMKRDMAMSRLGSSDEVRVLRWLKAMGEKVRKGEA
jgi:pyruvate/2-oxoglutarate dehydrogenase complex dihydrolipoamide acyltransferase (E2) component